MAPAGPALQLTRRVLSLKGCHSPKPSYPYLQAVTPPETVAEEGPDLSCLDHSYFQQETERLLRRANSTQLGVTRAAYGSGRRGSVAADEASVVLQQVIGALEECRWGAGQSQAACSMHSCWRRPGCSVWAALRVEAEALWPGPCRHGMAHEVPFDAEAVLHELYNLESIVSSVAAGSWAGRLGLGWRRAGCAGLACLHYVLVYCVAPPFVSNFDC